MPIVEADIKQFYTPLGNADQALSLGGTASVSEITDNVDNNLMPDVGGIEAAAGSTKYRGRYYKNNHGSLELQNAKAFIATQTTSADDAVAIGVDPAGSGDGSTTGVMTTIADEDSAPAGVSFSAPATYGAGIALAGMTFGKYIGLWDRRIVTPGASALDVNQYQVTVQGETAE